jgi:hypothetical protein
MTNRRGCRCSPSLRAAIVVLFVAVAAAYSATSQAAQRQSANEGQRTVPLAPVIDPYRASLAFARCMRGHGVAYPNPDRAGNFRLRPADERRLRRSSAREREAAEKACFRYLRPVVSVKPLSSRAKALARKALRGFAGCMRAEGFGFFFDPVVTNLTLGRAFFGFKRTASAIRKVERSQRFRQARTACELKLNRKLDRIIANDRGDWIP